ncbi:MAG TPA: glycosyltransferase, partial [Gammaproteobacteria bacterium]|nr:glycosyltransferase [Gammaproteobacteria bacterium]
NFDLVTGFSVMPLQIFSIAGFVITILAGILVVYMVVDRLVEGPQVQGVFTLFAIAFFLIGITLFGIGLLGEYVGRIYQEVQRRPRYLVRAILEKKKTSDD